ncbi:MAG TPA: hypothetical protein VLA03_04040, partial [Draconibacterium sp.]|nr:hypothetical protein [Draconibacterium sp.]
MKNEIVRRVFVKKLAGLSLGACVIPKSLFFCKYNYELFNTHNSTAESEVHCQVDWQKMMKDHDLVWNKVPLEMKEAPHFGNGLLGSMLWVEENKIRLQIFRTDVHDHADHTYGWSVYSRPRYQIGYLLLEPKGEIISCNLRQDIYNAELIGRINTSLGNISIHHLVHRLDDVIYTETEAIGGEELSGWEWHPFEAKSSRGGDPGEERYGKTYAPYNKLENPEHIINKHDNINVSLQDLTHGGNYATAWEEYKIEDAQTGMLISIEY